MAAADSFMDLIREDTEADTAILLKQIVNAGIGSADTKQTLRKRIDEIFGRPDSRENLERIERFKFEIPPLTLEAHIRAVKLLGADPVRDVHYKIENGVSYANSNEHSWSVNEEDEGWKAVDIWRDDKIAEGKQSEVTDANLGLVFADAKRKARADNRKAQTEAPTWSVLARTQTNDYDYEDSELRFKEITDERDKSSECRDTDWNQNLTNIKRLGEQLGYTEVHYKHVLSRFISWFAPDLSVVTERLTADETARFLLRLNRPETELEKIEKQKAKLSRKPGQSLRPVMTFLQELAKEIHRKESEPERSKSIRHMMLLGLIRFTHGRLQEEIVSAIEYCKKEEKEISWENLMERSIQKESFYGAPMTELRFENKDKQGILYQSLYNVNTQLKETNVDEEIRQTNYTEFG